MNRRNATLALAAGLLITASTADAHPHRRHRRPPQPWRPVPIQTYATFKAGGYGADALNEQGDGDWGMFLGTEWGVSPVPAIELGMAIDWFHRNSTGGQVLVIDDPYALPVEIVAADNTTTDLIPIAAVIRARIPVGDGRVTPFVSGQLGWDMLRLGFRNVELDGNSAFVTEDTEWFHGIGVGAAVGVEAALGPGVGFLFEAGVHESEPSKDLLIDGVPVEARADAGGEYARAGVKFAF